MNKPTSSILTVLAASLVFAALCTFALPHYGDVNQPYDQVPDTLVTPHIPWAAPYAGGTLKALVILPYHMTREAIELKQRIDLDLTIIMTGGFNVRCQTYREGSIATPIFDREADLVIDKIMKERLLDRSKKYDVIFLGKMSWEIFTPEEKKCLYDRVKDGAGLVWFSPTRLENTYTSKKTVTTADPIFDELIGKSDAAATAAITRGLPMDVFPVEMFGTLEKLHAKFPIQHQNRTQMKISPAWIGTAAIGKGRSAVIDWDDGCITYSCDYRSVVMPTVKSQGFKFDYTLWDYSFALAARAILYATGREMAEKTAIEIPAEVWRGASVSAKVSGKGEAEFKLRTRKGKEVYSARKAAEGAVEFALPVIESGEYLADVRLLAKDGKVLDFASKRFTVKADIEVKSITTQKDRYEAGERIEGGFELSRPLKSGERIEVTAVDTWGRLVYRGGAKLAGAAGVFEIPVKDPLSRLWDLYATVKDARGPIASGTVWTGIPNWAFDDYTAMLIFCPMPGSLGWKGDLHTATMRRFGINAAYSGYFLHGGWHESELNERAHIQTVAYTDHFGEIGNQPELVSKGIANTNLDIYACTEMVKEVVRTGGQPLDVKKWTYTQAGISASHYNRKIPVYRQIARFGTPTYAVTGENYLSGEFGAGGAQGAENSGFGPKTTREFQKWCRKEYGDDIAALNKEWNTRFQSWDEVKGVMIEDAVENDQLPRWVDFRFFMRSEMWSGYLVELDAFIHTFCKGGRAGFGGHAQHDFTKYRGSCMTSGKLYVSQKDNWEWLDAFECEIRQSFSGDDGWWLGSQSNIRWTSDLNNPISRKRIAWAMLFMGLRGTDFENALASETFGGMSWTTPDYSKPLPFFKEVTDEVLKLERGIGKLFINSKPWRSKTAIDWSPRNHYISRLLHGRQPRGFSGSWLYNISLIDGAPNDALGMMNSLRMRPTIVSPDDVEANLVKRGFKALWLPYNKGMSLKEAAAVKKFVRDGGLVLADNEPATYSEHGRPLAKEEYRLKELFPDFSKPAITPYGKGKAAYLAGKLNCYPDRMLEGDFKGSDVVAGLLDTFAGEKPPVEMTDERGMPARDVRMVEHDRGGVRMIGFLRQHVGDAQNDTKPYMLNFGGEYEVYDLYHGTYLGRHGSLSFGIDRYPAMLALCPVKTVSAELDVDSVKRGGEIELELEVEFKGDNKAQAADCWHLEIYDPDGKPLEYYAKNVIVEGRTTEFKLPVALDAKPGDYRAEMVSAISGVKAGAKFEVK